MEGRTPCAPTGSLINDSIGAEGLAVFPRAEHVDVVARLRAPDVDGTLLIHLADVDLHRQPARVVAHFQVSVMLMGTDDCTAHPAALAVRHALIRRIPRVGGGAGEGDVVGVHAVAGDDAAEADLIADADVVAAHHGHRHGVHVGAVVQRDLVLIADARDVGDRPLRRDAVGAIRRQRQRGRGEQQHADRDGEHSTAIALHQKASFRTAANNCSKRLPALQCRAVRDFAFVQTAPERVFIGWGPFEQLPFRRPGRPAFFISDFFLDDPHPWRHPATWEELALEELAARFPAGEPPLVEWERTPVEEFERTFASARAAFDRGDFKKIVPILFESGRLARGERWRWFFERLAVLPPGMWAYGYSYQNHGVVGATPEMLFRAEARGYRTMALAGTRPVALADELLRDP